MCLIPPFEASICFQDFLIWFVVCFQLFDYNVPKCGFVVVVVFRLFGVCWSCICGLISFNNFEKNFSHYLFKYFFSPFLFFLFLESQLYIYNLLYVCEYFPPDYIICLPILFTVFFPILCINLNILYGCHWIRTL